MPDADSPKQKVTRIRLIYEKRGRACFVPHVALSALFARAARRAGMELSCSEGFSHRARISFGPELPAGVVALAEPADLWLAAREEASEVNRRELIESAVRGLTAQMPEGFLVTKYALLSEGAPALGKECRAAHYLVWVKNELLADAAELLAHMERHYGEAVLNGFIEQAEFSRVSVVLANPSQNGIGSLVKALVTDGFIGGWHDMRIVRVGLGRWNSRHMEPMGEGAAYFKV
jgi:radical SAM-linked protein